MKRVIDHEWIPDTYQPIHRAVLDKDLSSVKMLLVSNANVEARTGDIYQSTPLTLAATIAHIYGKKFAELVGILLRRGASINTPESWGNRTALDIVCRQDSLQYAQALIDFRAFPTVQHLKQTFTRHEKSPLTTLLLEAGAEIDDEIINMIGDPNQDICPSAALECLKARKFRTFLF